jgi:hypothetical protein
MNPITILSKLYNRATRNKAVKRAHQRKTMAFKSYHSLEYALTLCSLFGRDEIGKEKTTVRVVYTLSCFRSCLSWPIFTIESPLIC